MCDLFEVNCRSDLELVHKMLLTPNVLAKLMHVVRGASCIEVCRAVFFSFASRSNISTYMAWLCPETRHWVSTAFWFWL
jgi:hypothetical protein